MTRQKLSRRLVSFVLSLAMIFSVCASGLGYMGAALTERQNLALHKTVSASGNEVNDGRWTYDKVVDGVVSKESRWSSNTSDGAWLTVDLGESSVFDKIIMRWELRATRYRLEASEDGSNWQTIFDGYEAVDNKDNTNVIELDAAVTARYVKFQGIKRTPVDGTYYGYSLYEMEVYTPLDPIEAVNATYDALTVQEGAFKNFTVDVTGYDDSTISWESSDENIISIAPTGLATVTLPEATTDVTLTATITKRDQSREKKFLVKVFCEAEIPVVYEIYPKPQNLREGNMEFSYSGDFNVVFEDGVNAAARNYLAKVLASHGITASYSEAPVADKTNLILGISGAGGAADAYFENISYDASALTDYTDGYILSVSGRDEGTIAVLAQDASAAYFSLTTLDQMLATKPGVLSEVVIEDYADIPIRGFIEGYYGIPWGWDGRMNLVEWGATQKMNTYVYAPKDDPYHRAQWATLYPEEDCANITELAEVSHANNFNFVWTLHPGGNINLTSETDFAKAIAKLEQVYDLGVRQFGVLFDDIDVSDARTAATQQANFINRINDEFVKVKGDVGPLITVGTRYCKGWGPSMSAYFKTYVETLDPSVEIMWTGDNTMSHISHDVMEYPKAQSGGTKNMMVWWNYAVNDYDESKMMMGKLDDLRTDLDNVSGFVSNPMAHVEANKQSLFGIADFCWNTADFDYEASYSASFKSLAPNIAEELEQFAQQVAGLTSGTITIDESWDFTDDIAAFTQAMQEGGDLTEAAASLTSRFHELEAVCDTILEHKEEYKALLDELEPWVLSLRKVAQAGYRAVELVTGIGSEDASVLSKLYGRVSRYVDESRSYPVVVLNGQTNAATGTLRLLPFVNACLSYASQFVDVGASANLALGKNVKASGVEVSDGRWTPNFVVDGVVSKDSRWSSNYSDAAWIQVDLGDVYEVGIVVLKWETSKADKYYLQGSVDGENWFTIYDKYQNTSNPDLTNVAVINPTEMRYVKMQGVKRASQWGYSLYELEVYAPTDKTELSALYEAHKDLDPALYTPESYANFAEYLEEARLILEEEGVLQKYVDYALEDLQDAIAALVPVSVVEPLAVDGTPESGYARGRVILTAEKEAVWTVNGIQIEKASTTMQFTEEGTYTVTAKAGDAVSETIVFSIDRTAPVLEATAGHYDITNQDVTFTSNEEVTFYNGAEAIAEGTELTLTESGVYNIRAIDKAGNYTAFIRVTILKEAPVLTGVPETVTRANVAIRSNVKVLFTINGVEAEDYAYGLRVTEEGKYTVKAVDMAGNETEVSFEIDRTKPAFTASVPSGQPTNEDILLTANEAANFVVEGQVVATGTTYTVTESAVVYVYDLAGNYGGVYKANIDKTAPVLSAVMEGTNKAVENGATVAQSVTVKSSKAAQFIVNDGEPTARANFVKLRASGTYTVKAVDMLGNVSEVFTVTIAK